MYVPQSIAISNATGNNEVGDNQSVTSVAAINMEGGDDNNKVTEYENPPIVLKEKKSIRGKKKLPLALRRILPNCGRKLPLMLRRILPPTGKTSKLSGMSEF